jgi:dihydroorotate dehydrogenase (fumarate)
MDLATRYLGLTLEHPFVPGASPLTDTVTSAVRLEDAGAAAIVMHSLFEEDIQHHDVTPDRYLELIAAIKRRTALPVIASLNGTTPEGWLKYAGLIERAGADALEMNFYFIATDPGETAAAVEARVLDIVAVVKESASIPVAVKLSPFFSSLPHLAAQLDRLGADGLVLFNRFYQPDINPATLETTLSLTLSDTSELALRLRWIAVLYGRVRSSLAVTGGVHTATDAAKAILAGADVVQMVSALLKHGPEHLRRVRREFESWAEAHGHASLGNLRGRVSLSHCRTPETFERGNYVHLLQSVQGGTS